MINSGMMGMPLHFGKMPKWLTNRMGKLGSAIIESVAQNYGKSEVLTRLSDPNWFQALGAVMGMQWNSSGVTATVLGSLKRRVNPMASDLGIYILGGKGRGSETEERIDKRLERTAQEIEYKDKFDACIINDDLAIAAEELNELITKQNEGVVYGS